jgi:hypothetical protein
VTPGFFLAQLEKAQANYSAFDRELSAVVATIRHFHFMLEGRCFVVFTELKPLLGALSRRSELWSANQQHHLSFITEFFPTIHHMAGESNIVADHPCRLAGDLSVPPAPLQQEDSCVTICASEASPPSLPVDQMALAAV